MNPSELAPLVFLADTRPVAHLLVLLVSGFALVSGTLTLLALRYPGRVAWRTVLRLNGWLPLVAGAALLGGVIAFNDYALADQLRLVEIIVPLVMAAQAAFAFSPDDEPALEVAMACPRPLGWMLLERLALLFAAQSVIALLGTTATLALTGEPLTPLAALRWIPPAVLLTALASLVTISGRLALFGMGFTLIVWGVFVFVGDAFLPGMPLPAPLDLIQPYIWPFHPYAQPGRLPTADYALNRVGVLMLGLALLGLALRRLTDSEALLLGVRKRE